MTKLFILLSLSALTTNCGSIEDKQESDTETKSYSRSYSSEFVSMTDGQTIESKQFDWMGNPLYVTSGYIQGLYGFLISITKEDSAMAMGEVVISDQGRAYSLEEAKYICSNFGLNLIDDDFLQLGAISGVITPSYYDLTESNSILKSYDVWATFKGADQTGEFRTISFATELPENRDPIAASGSMEFSQDYVQAVKRMPDELIKMGMNAGLEQNKIFELMASSTIEANHIDYGMRVYCTNK
jgi:hypothetical protein